MDPRQAGTNSASAPLSAASPHHARLARALETIKAEADLPKNPIWISEWLPRIERLSFVGDTTVGVAVSKPRRGTKILAAFRCLTRHFSGLGVGVRDGRRV